ncbi:MAG: hypothetical protein E7679_02000 [Ruminococcaceae bacterium]|nr:hypothetical protein [Oscillospiraceae bacterium]
MGFGVMLIGYFITYVMALNTYGVFFRLLGYLMICRAAFKLLEYDKKFVYPFYLSVLLAALSGLEAVNFVYQLIALTPNATVELIANIVGYIDVAAVFVFHAALLFAIRGIAKDTGVSKVAVSAVRNFIVIVLYFVLYAVSLLPLPVSMAMPLTIVYLLWILLNVALLYSCYYRICDENDNEMARRPSRIGWVNNMWSKLDAKQEKAAREMEEYRAQKNQKKRKK